eukprot:289144-Heterocapsa_arctica.AAC.2
MLSGLPDDDAASRHNRGFPCLPQQQEVPIPFLGNVLHQGELCRGHSASGWCEGLPVVLCSAGLHRGHVEVVVGPEAEIVLVVAGGALHGQLGCDLHLAATPPLQLLRHHWHLETLEEPQDSGAGIPVLGVPHLAQGVLHDVLLAEAPEDQLDLVEKLVAHLPVRGLRDASKLLEGPCVERRSAAHLLDLRQLAATSTAIGLPVGLEDGHGGSLVPLVAQHACEQARVGARVELATGGPLRHQRHGELPDDLAEAVLHLHPGVVRLQVLPQLGLQLGGEGDHISELVPQPVAIHGMPEWLQPVALGHLQVVLPDTLPRLQYPHAPGVLLHQALEEHQDHLLQVAVLLVRHELAHRDEGTRALGDHLADLSSCLRLRSSPRGCGCRGCHCGARSRVRARTPRHPLREVLGEGRLLHDAQLGGRVQEVVQVLHPALVHREEGDAHHLQGGIWLLVGDRLQAAHPLRRSCPRTLHCEGPEGRQSRQQLGPGLSATLLWLGVAPIATDSRPQLAQESVVGVQLPHHLQACLPELLQVAALVPGAVADVPLQNTQGDELVAIRLDQRVHQVVVPAVQGGHQAKDVQVHLPLQEVEPRKLLLLLVHTEGQVLLAVLLALLEVVVVGPLAVRVNILLQAVPQRVVHRRVQAAEPVVGGLQRGLEEGLGSLHDGGRALLRGGLPLAHGEGKPLPPHVLLLRLRNRSDGSTTGLRLSLDLGVGENRIKLPQSGTAKNK